MRDLGAGPAIIEFASSKVTGLRTPITTKDIRDYAFFAAEQCPAPFAIGRFGDGLIGAFHSVLKEKIWKQGILFHAIDELNEIPSRARFYCFIECQFAGKTTDLYGHEVKFPCLVSETKKEYPFR